MTEVRVEGLRELEAKLKAIAAEFGGKKAINPVRNALRKAGRIVQKSAQQKVRVKTGAVKENIIVTNVRKSPPGEIGVNVTVRAKAKAYKDTPANRRKGAVGGSYQAYGPLYYARFLEFGTSRQPAYPFMRPAFEENKNTLPGIIRDELAVQIERAVAKLRK